MNAGKTVGMSGIMMKCGYMIAMADDPDSWVNRAGSCVSAAKFGFDSGSCHGF